MGRTVIVLTHLERKQDGRKNSFEHDSTTSSTWLSMDAVDAQRELIRRAHGDQAEFVKDSAAMANNAEPSYLIRKGKSAVKKQYRVTITDANLKADSRRRMEQKLDSYDGTKLAPNLWECKLTEQDLAFLERVHGRKLSIQIDE